MAGGGADGAAGEGALELSGEGVEGNELPVVFEVVEGFEVSDEEFASPFVVSFLPFVSVVSLGGFSFSPSNQPSILPASFLVFGDSSSRISKASTRSGDLPITGLLVPELELERVCWGVFFALSDLGSVSSILFWIEADRRKGFHDFFVVGGAVAAFSVETVFFSGLSFGAGGATFLEVTVAD